MHMFPHVNPTSTAAWNSLKHNAERLKQIHLKNLFQQDPERLKRLAILLMKRFLICQKT